MNKTTLKQIAFISIFVICMLGFISSPVALLTGFLFTLFFGNPYVKLGKKVSSLLLKASVVGLGFGMNVMDAIEAGKDGLLLTIFSITLTITLGYFIGKALKIERKTAHLTASGTAICGGSAIAAIGPVVEANDNEMSVSLGVIFFLNSIALFLFPAIGHFLLLSQQEFGLWSAIAIHDTSSVVGAAASYGEEALKIATTVKLARALWIIPLSIVTIFLFKKKNSKISIPWFIFLFIGAMLISSYTPNFEAIGAKIFGYSKYALTATLYLIGASLSIKSIKKVGARPLILGVILWIVASGVSLFSILYII
ncbi:MAG: putative sulfate exporter family transporter [Rikenellaceae bacterium]